MKERGLICSAWEVRAIEEGRKTQTRRPLKPQPTYLVGGAAWDAEDDGDWYCTPLGDYECFGPFRSPYGVPGDLLFVRETWSTSGLKKYHYTGDPDDHGGPNDPCCAYAATASYRCGKRVPDGALAAGLHKWRSPATMPRWASRRSLLVTDVRVERVQEISEEDARDEGALRSYPVLGAEESPYWLQHEQGTYGAGFNALWDSIYASKGLGWEANPWVWCYSFERVEA